MPNPKLETYKNKATGTVYDFTDADAQSKISATVALHKDTTGWIGGNEIKCTATTDTIGSVTFTVNSDKSISTSGTSTEEWVRFNIGRFIIPKGDYVFSGISGGSNVTYRLGIQTHVSGAEDKVLYNGTMELSFDVDSDITVYIIIRLTDVDMSGKTFYPMIITPEQYALNPSYRPYHESVEEEIQSIYDFNAKTGVHQLLDNTAVSKTENNVTFTVNADKTIDIVTSAVTTANANLKMTNPRMNSDNLPIGTYRASKKTTNANICMYVNAYNNTSYVKQLLFLDSKAEGLFTVDYDGYNFIEIGLTVPTGREVPTSIKVEPLVTYPEDKSNLITLPAMTNRQLTDGKLDKNPTALSSSDDLDNVFTDGWYKWSGASIPAHWVGDSWAAMRVLNLSGVTLQIVYTQNEIYIRRYGGSPMSWGSFYKFTGTVVS